MKRLRLFSLMLPLLGLVVWPLALLNAQHSQALDTAELQTTGSEEVQTTAPPMRELPNEAFGVGERLTFNIDYGFITAGQATMSIPNYKYINNRPTFQTEIEARSGSTFDWVFKVRDRYETFMDYQGLFPWRFEQHVREGSYSKDYDAMFDPVAKTATTSDGHIYQTPQYVQDIVSAFYYVRTLDLTHAHRGDVIHLQNFFDGETHPLDVRILGHQQIEVPVGTFECCVLEPMVVAGGLFKSEGSIKIWVTDDNDHIPVQMSSKILIGSIDAKLVKYEGLRSPLTSRVK